VAEAGKHTLGDLEVITLPAAFALRVLNLAHLTKPRLALIGDAAHNIHPLSGHGVNLGLRDARSWRKCCCSVARPIAATSRCCAATKRRARPTSCPCNSPPTRSRICSSTTTGAACLRNFGLGATNKLVPLKNMLVRHALN